MSLYESALFGLVTFLLALAALAAPKLASAEEDPKSQSALIFIPGYYGSALEERTTGKRFFVTAGTYFFGSQSVSLFTKELATPEAPDLVAGGVLDRIPIFFGLFGYDVYGSFLDQLRALTIERQQVFVAFGYDWRDDLSQTTRLLAARIRELRSQGITRIQIVAHSMGCLVAANYLAYGEQAPESAQLDWQGAIDVDRVAFLAPPFRGAFSLFRNMQTGAKIGSNRTYMPAETVASLPASYQLLPFSSFRLIARDGHRFEFPLHDIAEWESRRLGLLRSQSFSDEVKKRRHAFVAEQLTHAKNFSDRLLASATVPAPASLKVLQLVGHGHPTANTASYDPATKMIRFDSDTDRVSPEEAPLFEDGDGSVTTTSAAPLPLFGSNVKVLTSDRLHDKIYADPEFQKSLRDFLKSE